MSSSLFVIQGRDQGTKFELEDGTTGLGRDSSNPIQVHDTEVSRRHAEIRRVGETFLVADLNSSNGTFVNGKRVAAARVVERRPRASRQHADAVHRSGRCRVGGSVRQDRHRFPAATCSTARGSSASMSQQEGSEIFDLSLEGSPSPWLARARSNLQIMYRTALAVSHTPGHRPTAQPHHAVDFRVGRSRSRLHHADDERPRS